VADLLKGANGKDLVTQAILHIKPVEGETEARSSIIEPDVRKYIPQATGETQSEEKRVALAVLELRSIKALEGQKIYWPLNKWIEYATPYIVAAEEFSRRK
jgi:serine kinase of HPr protein (carbohydrate metabolism regulator)